MKRNFSPFSAIIPAMWKVRIASILVLALVSIIALTPPLVIIAGNLIPAPYAAFINLNIPHLIIILAVVAGCHIFLKQDIRPLIQDKPINNKSWIVFIEAFVVTAAVLIFSDLMTNGLSFNSSAIGKRITFLLLSLVLVPIQCLGEELWTRSLPLHFIMGPSLQVGTKPRKVIAVAICGLIFALLHLANPEFQEEGANVALLISWYFLFGAAASALAIWDGSFMAPWAIHSANNLHGALVIGYAASPYKTAPLFMRQGSAPVIEAMTTMTVIFTALALTRVLRHSRKTK